jgi:hypothetical protein
MPEETTTSTESPEGYLRWLYAVKGMDICGISLSDVVKKVEGRRGVTTTSLGEIGGG